MPPRPIFDHAMTPAERQRRRRLRLAGGPTARFEREALRALNAGMTAVELVQRIEAISGGTIVPAASTLAADETPTRYVSVTTPPPEPAPPVSAPEPIPAIAARWLAEFGARISEHRQPRRARAHGRIGLIYMKPPTTIGHLATLAHEIGHCAFQHGTGPSYIKEFQAELFMFALLARDGISFEPYQVAQARCYVGQKIFRATRSKARWIDPRIARWAAAFDPQAPDLKPRWLGAWGEYEGAVQLWANGCAIDPPTNQPDHYAETLERLAQMGLTVPTAVLAPTS